MKVIVELTVDEYAEAVREYCENHKGMILHNYTATKFYTNANGFKELVEFCVQFEED